MHKRRTSENFFNPPSSRKKLSAQFIDRTSPDQPFNKTEKIAISNLSSREVPIASIIQAKVANLKSKFTELDSMRQRLVESRCDSRLDSESKQSITMNSRARSGNSSDENYIQSRSPEGFYSTYSQEQYEIELHNERKITQKAILEKNLSERENSEKIKQLTVQLDKSKQEIEALIGKLGYFERVNSDLEEKIKIQKEFILTQAEEIESLTTQLLSADQSVKSLTSQIKGLEKNFQSLKESTSSAAVKNLSNIILSKDSSSPTKIEPNSQVINRYLDTLQELLNTDQFTLSVILKMENNNLRKAQQDLMISKSEIIKRMQRTNLNIEEIEKYIFDCRSPSTINRSVAEFMEFNSESEADKIDYLYWIKCQAAVVEDLILISDMSK